MKRIIKLMIAAVLIVGISNVPILHQDLPTYKCYFSLVESIHSDIIERQTNTPYFIYTSVKDLLLGC